MESRFSRIFERLLVFSTVVSLTLTATSIFSTALNNYDVERILVDWFTYIIIIVSGIIFTIVLQIFAMEKIKPAMHIVFIVFYIIAILGLCYFTGKRDAPYVLIFILLIQYFLEAGINDLFIFHDDFMMECESHDGKELEQYLFHNNLTAIDLTEKIKSQQVVMFAVSIAMFIVLVFGKASKGLFTSVTIALIVIFYLSVLLCGFMLGIFKNDIFYAFLGFKDYIHDGRKLLGAVLLIAGIACGAGALLSSDTPIIKINFIEEYKDRTITEQRMPLAPDLYSDIEIEPESHEMLGRDARPIWILEFIAEFIKYAAIVVLAFLALYFFIRPFFTNHFRVFWSDGHLIKFLNKLWNELKEFLRFVFSKDTRVKQAYSTVQSKKFKESMMDFLKKTKRSKEKIMEIDRLTKHFMRLIDWGQSQGIKYVATLAPAEYTALISEKSEEIKKPAVLAGQLFEKALYDKNVLSAEEENLFISSIDAIIKP